MKDYSEFFEVADALDNTSQKIMQHRLYFDDEGAIIDISYEEHEGNFIIITEDEYNACYMKRNDYTVIDQKLVFTPPKRRNWYLKQDKLARNPYTCNK